MLAAIIVDWAGVVQGSGDEEVLLLLGFDLVSKAGLDVDFERVPAVDVDSGLGLIYPLD